MLRLLANILWFLFGGFAIALLYVLGGFLLCLTIVGIPFGIQCMKLSVLGLAPFGLVIKDSNNLGRPLELGLNVLWILLGGLWIALTHLILAVVLAITIIGIPFAIQHVKLSRLSLIPFGSKVVTTPL